MRQCLQFKVRTFKLNLDRPHISIQLFIFCLYCIETWYFILNQSVNVDAKDKVGGFTAVMLAAMNGHQKVLTSDQQKTILNMTFINIIDEYQQYCGILNDILLNIVRGKFAGIEGLCMKRGHSLVFTYEAFKI